MGMMLRLWVSFVFLFVAFFVQAAEDSPRRVLLLTSGNMAVKWTDQLSYAFVAALKSLHPDVAVSQIEFDPEAGTDSPDYFARYLTRVREGRYQLVVTADNTATERLLAEADSLPKDLPVVFCGYVSSVQGRRVSSSFPDNWTGVLQKSAALETVELARALLPGMKKMLIVADSSDEAAGILESLRHSLGESADPEILYFDSAQNSMDVLFNTVSKLPEESCTVLIWKSGKYPQFRRMRNMTQALNLLSAGPVFSTLDAYFNFGVLGGVMNRASTHGTMAAQYAGQILNGTPISNLPMQFAPVHTIIDELLLAGHPQADSSKLPPDTIRMNGRKESLSVTPRMIAVVVGIIGILVAALVFLLWTRRRVLRTQSIYHALPLRISVCDRGHHFLFCQYENKKVVSITNLAQLPDENIAELFMKNVDQVFESQRPCTWEYVSYGRRRRATCSVFPHNAFGCDAVIIVSSDIEELHDSQLQLELALERLRITLNSIGDGVIATDTEERITLVNPVAASLIGSAPEEMIGKSLDDVFRIVSYLDDSTVGSPLRRALAENTIVELANHTDLIRTDGTRRHIADSAAPIRNAADETVGAVLVFRDVTQEYEQREQLRQTVDMLEYAGSVAQFAFFACDQSGKTLQKSSAFKFWPEVNGTSIDYRELIIPEDCEMFLSEWHALLGGHKNGLDFVYRSDYWGDRRCFHMRVVRYLPSQDGGEEKNRYLGSIQDITDARRNEMQYRETSMLFQTILEKLPCSIFVKDLDDQHRYLIGNDYYHRLFQLPPGAFVGKTDLEFYPEEEARKYQADDLRVAESGTPIDQVELVTLPGGRSMYSRTVKNVVRQEGSGHRLLLGISLDITDAKTLEKELRQYAEREKMINDCLRAMMFEEASDKAINIMLCAIGRYAGADRSYIFEYKTAQNVADNTFEWVAEGIEPQIANLHDVSLDKLSDWTDELKENRMLHCDDLDDALEPSMEKCADVLRSQNIRSLQVCGIWCDGELWGFVGLDYVKRTQKITESAQLALKTAAQLMGINLERQKARSLLLVEEQEKTMILDTVDVPILLFDHSLVLRHANRAACNLVGRSESEILENPCEYEFCSSCGGSTGALLAAAEELGVRQQRDIKFMGKDFQFTAEPIFDDGRQLRYMLCSYIDVTELNEKQRQLELALAEAKAAIQAKSFFLATMSHELRTPLNAVIGFSELLQSGTMSAKEQQESLNAINIAGTTLLTLINDILDLSKLEAGKLQLARNPLVLPHLLDELLTVFKLRALDNGVDVSIHYLSALPTLLLDSMRLRQVLLNLIGNAVKFTEKGHVTIEASFVPQADKDRGTLTISVKDSGCGIPKQDLDEIFEAFVQRDHVPGGKAYEGTGLGLPISRRLAHSMGGEIRATSEEGVGSTFVVELYDVEYIPGDMLHGPELQNDQELACPLPTQGERLMIVDDVPMNLKVLQAMLRRLGLSAVACGSAGEALAAAEQELPSMVLTDLWMPEMSGEELAWALRKRYGTRAPRIVALTADTQLELRDDGPFDGVLYKPLTLEKLQGIFADK